MDARPQGSPNPIYGTMSAGGSGPVNTFVRDQPGTSLSVFFPDASINDGVKGVYTAPSQTGQPGTFKLNNPNQTPKQNMHGQM